MADLFGGAYSRCVTTHHPLVMNNGVRAVRRNAIVLSMAGDQVAIAFPDQSTRTFLAAFVTPA